MSLQTTYKEEVQPKLKEELGIKNLLAVPKLIKIVIDAGIGELSGNQQALLELSKDLSLITGQKPEVRRAKKAVAGFNIRAGDAVGLRVTLRGKRMFDFLERLCRIVLPRVRDFRGVRVNSFDGRGNFNLGLTEHTLFPEVDSHPAGKAWGFGITIVTTAKTNEEAKRLLEEMGMPFEKVQSSN